MNPVHKQKITHADLAARDEELEAINRERFSDDISHLNRTLDLLMAIFENSKRSDETKSDYLKLLAVRIVQDSRSAMDLALKGMFPQAMGLTRGVLMTILLIKDFELHPENEQIWAEGSRTKREDLFKDEALRARVTQDGATGATEAAEIYKIVSQIAIHTNIESLLWYLETKDGKHLLHWAGQDDIERARQTITPVITGAALAVVALFDGGFFVFDNKEIVENYKDWKSSHAALLKKAYGDMGLESAPAKPETLTNIPPVL